MSSENKKKENENQVEIFDIFTIIILIKHTSMCRVAEWIQLRDE